MTGKAVSGSNSVELAPGMPQTLRANSATAHCMPRHTPRNGTLRSRQYRIGLDLALDAALAEAAGHDDAVGAARRSATA